MIALSLTPARHDAAHNLLRVRGQGVLVTGVREALVEDVAHVHAALLGFEEDVERALACLGAGSH
ncbi:hypothetical protein GCM10025876_38980 [Demequina litorisediminis]|uniref:Uncharacterized protein n=1 Tax=Demequina litorisediminis TaxID=1849022 RepID=A0ABQ6ILY6_9MICO|nr:hypothetical protein GCM10025876_38980 [Demequina litorisediminis]